MSELRLIAGNWKMNTSISEALYLIGQMLPELDRLEGTEKAICPPFVSLAALFDKLKDTSITLGAQNIYFEPKGAYTGEISAEMVRPFCKYVVLGHSERRHLFGETNWLVNQKVKAAYRAGLVPILCVGENLEQRNAGKAEEIVTCQLNESLAELELSHELVVAYEPVWAIGTGLSAEPADASYIMDLIRENILRLKKGHSVGIFRLLYGGSVTAENIAGYLKQPSIDGALVGGASLKPDQFLSIVRQAAL